MSDSTFNPQALFATYRDACAPALVSQQEGIKTLDRFGRYQYAVAGDFLEWSMAQAKAAIAAQTPTDFVSKQVELNTALSEKLRTRAREFATLVSETQSGITAMVSDATAKVVESTKKKAA